MNKVNMTSIANKIKFIYGDACEKNAVGMVIFSDGTDYFFDVEYKNKMSNEEVEALLLRGAVIFKDGKYYRPASFDDKNVSLSGAVVDPDDIEVDLSDYATKEYVDSKYNKELYNEITFEEVKRGIPEGQEYEIPSFSTWSKWSAVTEDMSKITTLDNGGIIISIDEALSGNLVLNKSDVNLQERELILKFDITVLSIINNDDGFSIALNDTISLGAILLNDYNIGETTTITIPFNSIKLSRGKIALVLKKCCNCRLENLILEESVTVEGYQTLDEVVDDVEFLMENSKEIKELILPSVIPVVKEFETNIFWDNVLLNTNIKSVERIDVANSIGGRSNVLEDRWRIMLPSNTSSITQTVNVYYNDTSNISESISVAIPVLEKALGNQETRKIIFIGDSLTDGKPYVQEVKTLLTNDNMNIEILGSRGDGSSPHEGRSGWSSKHYCTMSSYNNIDNAFLNPNSSKFDFTYYMQQQNYESVDYVFINLGTNDLANDNNETIRYFKEMVNSIKTFNNNIVVFIGLCPPLSSRNDNYRLKNKRIELMKLLLEEFDNKQNNRILINPLVLNFDAYNGFHTTDVSGPRHTNENLKIVSDYTHPSSSEYYKMADTIYCCIKYAISLGY